MQDFSCVWFTCKIVRSSETHTHPFNGPLSGTTQVGPYQKGKNQQITIPEPHRSAILCKINKKKKHQKNRNTCLKQWKYLWLIFEENFEIDITAKNWVGCHTLQKYFMHGNSLLECCQVFPEIQCRQVSWNCIIMYYTYRCGVGTEASAWVHSTNMIQLPPGATEHIIVL